jgi:hypothetical protein
MEQTDHWFSSVSERYPDANSPNLPSFSTLYARQPYEATHVFGDHGLGSGSHRADSSLQPTIYSVPRPQDGEHLVELRDSESFLTPEFKKSHCQRILSVWRVVLNLCEANRDLALRTWVKLLDGEGEDDIWLWADGDEERLGTSYNLRSDSPSLSWYSKLGWKLSDSDLHSSRSQFDICRFGSVTMGCGHG